MDIDGSIGIVLAFDHHLIRSSLRLLLEREGDFRVIAEAANGREAILLAQSEHPEVLLLDVSLPQMSGIAAAREISSSRSRTAIIFVTSYTDEVYVSEAFKAGARGYVFADTAQADLVHAVRLAAAGRQFISPSIDGNRMRL